MTEKRSDEMFKKNYFRRQVSCLTVRRYQVYCEKY